MIAGFAPYGPEWSPSDFPEDIPITMEEHVQKAVDCYNAGATVLHLHVRELDGKGSKRLSKFNELIAGVRKAVPDMIIQVGGSISFAPETAGEVAKWLSDDTRHLLAELDPEVGMRGLVQPDRRRAPHRLDRTGAAVAEDEVRDPRRVVELRS